MFFAHLFLKFVDLILTKGNITIIRYNFNNTFIFIIFDIHIENSVVHSMNIHIAIICSRVFMTFYLCNSHTHVMYLLIVGEKKFVVQWMSFAQQRSNFEQKM